MNAATRSDSTSGMKGVALDAVGRVAQRTARPPDKSPCTRSLRPGSRRLMSRDHGRARRSRSGVRPATMDWDRTRGHDLDAGCRERPRRRDRRRRLRSQRAGAGGRRSRKRRRHRREKLSRPREPKTPRAPRGPRALLRQDPRDGKGRSVERVPHGTRGCDWRTGPVRQRQRQRQRQRLLGHRRRSPRPGRAHDDAARRRTPSPGDRPGPAAGRRCGRARQREPGCSARPAMVGFRPRARERPGPSLRGRTRGLLCAAALEAAALHPVVATVRCQQTACHFPIERGVDPDAPAVSRR